MSRSPSQNHASAPSARARSSARSLSPRTPQPLSSSIQPVSVYSTVSRSGDTCRPCGSTSSPTLPTTTTSAAGTTSTMPCRKRAPPTPPASTVMGESSIAAYHDRRGGDRQQERCGRMASAARRRDADRGRRLAVGHRRRPAKAAHDRVVGLDDRALRARDPDVRGGADPVAASRPDPAHVAHGLAVGDRDRLGRIGPGHAALHRGLRRRLLEPGRGDPAAEDAAAVGDRRRRGDPGRAPQGRVRRARDPGRDRHLPALVRLAVAGRSADRQPGQAGAVRAGSGRAVGRGHRLWPARPARGRTEHPDGRCASRWHCRSWP